MRPAPQVFTPYRASVYVLLRRDRRRFKLGWARRPLARVRQLPEFQAGELDLEASSAIWLPSRPRAEQIERSMHKTLAPYATTADHHGDGHQEWFEAVAHPTALRMLAQMPVDERTDRPARVVPLQLPPPHPDAVSIETGPQDTWWAIEDLWSRLAMWCAMTVEQGAEPRVTVHGIRRFAQGPVWELRQAAMDPESYQCRRGGRLLAFLCWIDYRGDDLVLQMAPLKSIERWDDGPDLVWQVRAFLVRLARSARLPR